MTEIQTEVAHYGFINTEFVQWFISKEGHLVIYTLHGIFVYIGANKWERKSSFLGPGNIEFKFTYDGKCFLLKIKMNPLRESDANEMLFRSGRNGVFNFSSRPFSSIFKLGHEQINPDKVWPFSDPENKIARGIAKTAIYNACAGTSGMNLSATISCIRENSIAWIEVFGAINIYAIMSNAFSKTDEQEYRAIHRALPHEFCALGFFTIYPAFSDFTELLGQMEKLYGQPDARVLGSWALTKTAYGSGVHPREKSMESKLELVGEELCNHLATVSVVSAQMEALGQTNWEE